MEVDASWPLARAHELATRLETEIRSDFGPGTEVETHVEPLVMTAGDGEDAGSAIVAAILAELTEAARRGGVIRDVHNVRARATKAGLIVNFHCRAEPSLDVASVHAAVDEVERSLRRTRSDIARVVGHAEPALSGAAVD